MELKTAPSSSIVRQILSTMLNVQLFKTIYNKQQPPSNPLLSLFGLWDPYKESTPIGSKTSTALSTTDF